MAFELWCVRHAHTLPGANDHARALSRLGEEQAQGLGAWLAQRAPRPLPELAIYVSDAQRTQETAWAIETAWRDAGGAVRVAARSELYLSGPNHLWKAALEGLRSGAPRVAVVAHNPGMGVWVQSLVGSATRIPSYAPASCACLQGERIDQLGPEPGTAGLRLAELRLGD